MPSPQTNVDLRELNHFEELAHHWWDPESEFRTLHDINPIRLKWIEEEVPLEGKAALDIACGGGLLSEGMALRGAKVTGIDLSEKLLGVARLHLLESGLSVDYQKISAEDMAKARPGQFDLVTCLEMLEHVPDPSSIIHACYCLLKPGGKAFFSTLNRNLKSWLFAIVGAEHILNLMPKGTHNHSRFIKPSELSRWNRQAGFLPYAPVGLCYNPFTRICCLGKDVSVNYLMAAVKSV